ncbi:MAG: hypothetical protein GXP63_02115 [DPANN group archaeon]|nr:hypothetical protein [DPANN group archaeon]
METYRQTKADWKRFLEALMKGRELIAPVKRDLVRFERVKDIEDIHLKSMSYFPAKHWFFPEEQTLFRFSKKGFEMPKQKEPRRVFFGLRKCDLNAIKHQDMVFIKQAKDPYYKALRKKSLLLGYHCRTAPSPFCFCESLGLPDFFDLLYYERKDHFVVEVGSAKGKALVKKYGRWFHAEKGLTPEQRRIKNADTLEETDIGRFYDHPGWKEGVNLCLSCGACTALCPTCYCHSIHDEVTVADPGSGERKRQWSSCQLQGFTKVAGGHVFRKDRESRFKHRIYHQLEWFREKNKVPLCTGCGRCIQGCPTRIDWVSMINRMKDDEHRT